MNLTVRCLTRQGLITYTPFRFPLAGVRHVPPLEREAARDVPGLTYEQIRTCERHGFFDEGFPRRRPSNGLMYLAWRLRRRRRGDVPLYSLQDLMVARLVAWMLRDGWAMQEIAYVLRGAGGACALMFHPSVESVVMVRHGRDIYGCAVPAGEQWPVTDPAAREKIEYFPLAWLGMGRDGPKIAKELDGVRVVRWNQTLTVPELQQAQAREASASM